MKISGSCTCGAITYECSTDPVMQGNCHCRECQRMTGSAYSATMFFPEQSVRINGDVKYFIRTGDSGSEVSRGFCPACGTQLFGKPGIMKGLIGVRAGTLDDPNNYHPAVDLFTRSAASWDHMNPSIPKFETYPPR